MYHPRVHLYCAVSLSVFKELCFLNFWPHRMSAHSIAARHPAACHPGLPALGLVSLFLSVSKSTNSSDWIRDASNNASLIQSEKFYISLTHCFLTASTPLDCTQEKSMFCRVSADRTQGGEMRYYPFRFTPYQLTIKDSDAAEPQPCCLLIAEKVHSGYEGYSFNFLISSLGFQFN